MTSKTIAKPDREFLPKELEINHWEDIKPYFEDLVNRDIQNLEDLKKWMKDRSELESFVGENGAWRFINHSKNTTDKALEEDYLLFVKSIEPHLYSYDQALDQKLVNCPYVNELEDRAYEHYFKHVRNSIELYREENIPIFTELQEKAQRFISIASQMTVKIDGQEFTIPQASIFLLKPDRDKRREVFNKVKETRLQYAEELDNLYSELVGKRHQVALNADFSNYRDFKFLDLGRFDYSVDDVMQFHESIKQEILPVQSKLNKIRKEKLGVESLKPYDLSVDMEGKDPLKPAKNGEELIEVAVQCLTNVHPDIGDNLRVMREMGHLDLESRKGKAPGGFNYPLDEIGIPFIFMNAKGALDDLVTLVHESGHALHSFLVRDFENNFFKHPPSEVAELASMSLELMSMEHWDAIFQDEDALRRAKIEQLEDVLKKLPWIAIISRFQHWVYTHPEHTIEERDQAWLDIYNSWSSSEVDWSGFEDYRLKNWQRQLHLFEVPFYYIEYGMAQLGAVAIWKNYKENAEKALNQYFSALKLGFTKPIPEIYQAAGIEFNFSKAYVRELADFINQELDKLEGASQ